MFRSGFFADIVEQRTRLLVLPRLDFTSLQVDPTTYVTAEYRHVTSDLVLTLSLLPTAKGRRKRRLTISILIELQAQPDRIMLLQSRPETVWAAREHAPIATAAPRASDHVLARFRKAL